jgi:hypothetical protein
MDKNNPHYKAFLRNISNEPPNARARRRLMQREIDKLKKKLNADQTTEAEGDNAKPGDVA